MNLIENYWHYWVIFTTLTWIAFFVGYAIINRYGGKSNSFTRGLRIVFNYGLDLPCNYFLSGFPFLDFPRNWTELVTDRLHRYVYFNGAVWRWQIAIWLCRRLSRADKDHCEKGYKNET